MLLHRNLRATHFFLLLSNELDFLHTFYFFSVLFGHISFLSCQVVRPLHVVDTQIDWIRRKKIRGQWFSAILFFVTYLLILRFIFSLSLSMQIFFFDSNRIQTIFECVNFKLAPKCRGSHACTIHTNFTFNFSNFFGRLIVWKAKFKMQKPFEMIIIMSKKKQQKYVILKEKSNTSNL